MWSRCYNPNRKDYSRYGGRGITICDEWEDYKTFEKWMLDNGWKPGMSVDRIDNDKGYYPSNCRVVPKAKNTRHNHSSKWIKVKHSTPISSLVYA